MSNGPLFEYKPTEYYVKSVLYYTSRYNNLRSIGYAPENLVGKALRYPDYGDFPDTYTLRTYGEWWNKSGSAQSDYRPQDKDPFGAEDYIVVRFEKAVIPKNVFIYEVYNPGAVVRVWGRYSGGNWKILWEGPPRLCVETSRKFDPPIREICSVVNEIRLDLNQSHLKYHTALDAIVLVGYTPKTELQFKLLANTSIDFLSRKKKKVVIDNSDTTFASDTISLLPYEVILHIFQYLDLKSIYRCAQVNKRWYEISKDPCLYYTLSLKRYWHKIDNNLLLNVFTPSCKNIRKLDLSWCGNDDRITEDVFVSFLKYCGQHLTHLSLGHCRFVKKKAFKEIAKCNELVDLRLRSCHADSRDYSVLSSLNRLTALDLYSCKIIDEALVAILKANQELKHLILDFCDYLKFLDVIAKTVSQYNQNLETWSSWKVCTLTVLGVRYLSKCEKLKELDLGWNSIFLDHPGDGLEKIALNCKNLKRLVISRGSGVTDNTIRPIIRYCENLEQLDMVGVMGITDEICEMALFSLKKLKLLDISFCKSISEAKVTIWKKEFPHVTIQRSCLYPISEPENIVL